MKRIGTTCTLSTSSLLAQAAVARTTARCTACTRADPYPEPHHQLVVLYSRLVVRCGVHILRKPGLRPQEAAAGTEGLGRNG